MTDPKQHTGSLLLNASWHTSKFRGSHFQVLRIALTGSADHTFRFHRSLHALCSVQSMVIRCWILFPLLWVVWSLTSTSTWSRDSRDLLESCFNRPSSFRWLHCNWDRRKIKGVCVIFKTVNWKGVISCCRLDRSICRFLDSKSDFKKVTLCVATVVCSMTRFLPWVVYKNRIYKPYF